MKYRPGYIPAIGWFLFSTYLFCLPGSAFPDSDWLIQIQFDKLVHVSIFSVQVFLVCWGYWGRTKSPASAFTTPFVLFTLTAVAFGVVIEFLQDGYIPNRSFQIGDIVADCLGSSVGLLLSHWCFGKK